MTENKTLSPLTPPRILISGAGIAGLALARRLDSMGIAYTLIEQRDSMQQSTSGIALPFNAIKALEVLGLDQAVLASAHQVKEVVYCKPSGRILSKASLQQPPINQAPYVALQRSQLHQILSKDLAQNIHFSTSLTDVKQSTNGPATCTFTDSRLNGEFDLIVAAEGINSPLRQQFCGQKDSIVDYQIPNWRFIVEMPDHGLQPTYMLGRTELFMVYPVSPDTLYCYAHVYDEAGQYSTGDAKQHLMQIFSHFRGSATEILSKLDDIDVIPGRLRSVDKPYFSNGRVVYVGDAANACSPLLQQGAAAAFEDIICLSTQLKKQGLDDAITAYQQLRSDRIHWVHHASDAPIAKMKMMQSPIAAFARNTVIRLKGPINVQGWRKLAQQDGLVV
ncbi:2-polyprenyl-6-methoxyphenol hydroxylase-like FAD-dependent oxidoreductase [Sinobacterium caligoides]|uniref:2-polyprenyl-6-methoxyphenol hydroxylase-like FAD-dependent oxidoreductase n=1 Tax=Sinobacterium caligoides TaxID=933926 RepID=A0A3N2E0Y0_9GAMM|nr:FAD-dependent monooxygenase [Sinobacterium caligoides]ROS05687.1 2-polyprenyl-6-methoxyphenol hydroxylase-like FAD-dependent oxidoreductase [Sinobacterium caligoides]